MNNLKEIVNKNNSKEVLNKQSNVFISLILLIISIFLIRAALIQGAEDKKLNLIDQDGDSFYTVAYKDKEADCDDTDKSIYPAASEIQEDGIDQNCDGIDESLSFDLSIFEEKFKDYNNYKNLPQLSIYKNFITPAEINRKAIIETSKKIKVEGFFEEVYLFVKAGVGQKLNPLGTYDSIYFYIDTGDDGGHLIRSRSFPIEKKNVEKENGDNYTILLYKNTIPMTFLPYKEREPSKSIDLLNKLNNNKYQGKHYLGVFVSTEQYGEIVEMSIGYKCLEESKCSISLIY